MHIFNVRYTFIYIHGLFVYGDIDQCLKNHEGKNADVNFIKKYLQGTC